KRRDVRRDVLRTPLPEVARARFAPAGKPARGLPTRCRARIQPRGELRLGAPDRASTVPVEIHVRTPEGRLRPRARIHPSKLRARSPREARGRAPDVGASDAACNSTLHRYRIVAAQPISPPGIQPRASGPAHPTETHVTCFGASSIQLRAAAPGAIPGAAANRRGP